MTCTSTLPSFSKSSISSKAWQEFRGFCGYCFCPYVQPVKVHDQVSKNSLYIWWSVFIYVSSHMKVKTFTTTVTQKLSAGCWIDPRAGISETPNDTKVKTLLLCYAYVYVHSFRFFSSLLCWGKHFVTFLFDHGLNLAAVPVNEALQ